MSMPYTESLTTVALLIWIALVSLIRFDCDSILPCHLFLNAHRSHVFLRL